MPRNRTDGARTGALDACGSGPPVVLRTRPYDRAVSQATGSEAPPCRRSAAPRHCRVEPGYIWSGLWAQPEISPLASNVDASCFDAYTRGGDSMKRAAADLDRQGDEEDLDV